MFYQEKYSSFNRDISIKTSHGSCETYLPSVFPIFIKSFQSIMCAEVEFPLNSKHYIIVL